MKIMSLSSINWTSYGALEYCCGQWGSESQKVWSWVGKHLML